MIVITPIAVTSVDWHKLLGAVSTAIERPVGRGLDSRGIAERGLAELISVLGEFHTENSDPVLTQRNAGFLLKFASVSFFVAASADAIHELLLAGRVAVLESDNPQMVILSASLEDWRTTIINLCAEIQTRPMRLFGTKLLQAFDELGLTRIFEFYSRRTSQQGGVILSLQK